MITSTFLLHDVGLQSFGCRATTVYFDKLHVSCDHCCIIVVVNHASCKFSKLCMVSLSDAVETLFQTPDVRTPLYLGHINVYFVVQNKELRLLL